MSQQHGTNHHTDRWIGLHRSIGLVPLDDDVREYLIETSRRSGRRALFSCMAVPVVSIAVGIGVSLIPSSIIQQSDWVIIAPVLAGALAGIVALLTLHSWIEDRKDRRAALRKGTLECFELAEDDEMLQLELQVRPKEVTPIESRLLVIINRGRLIKVDDNIVKYRAIEKIAETTRLTHHHEPLPDPSIIRAHSSPRGLEKTRQRSLDPLEIKELHTRSRYAWCRLLIALGCAVVAVLIIWHFRSGNPGTGYLIGRGFHVCLFGLSSLGFMLSSRYRMRLRRDASAGFVYIADEQQIRKLYEADMGGRADQDYPLPTSTEFLPVSHKLWRVGDSPAPWRRFAGS